MQTLLISCGAVAGANARYWIGVFFSRFLPIGFPWATLTINVSGSLVLGGFLAFATLRLENPGWRLLVAVGFCGAYTMFSTFTYEVVTLLREGSTAAALGYVAASLVFGVAAMAVGYVVGTAAGRV